MNNRRKRMCQGRKILSILLVVSFLFGVSIPSKALAASLPELSKYHFSLVQKQELTGGQFAYLMKHASGAQVLFLDDGVEEKAFAVGFRTPATDNKGAYHVLEHAVLDGSELFPSRDLFSYMGYNTVASLMNASTYSDYTLFPFITYNEKDYDNLLEVYLSSVFSPMFLKEENIFKKEGIRKECRDGKVYYNGIIYNEVKGNSTKVGSVLTQISGQLYDALYKDSGLGYNSGGTVEGLKTLTYEDLVSAYESCYVPSNCMVYLSGTVNLPKTLEQLDQYFTKYHKEGAEKIAVRTQLAPTNQALTSTFSGAANENTYAAGIMTSGIKVSDPKAAKAVELIYNYLGSKLSSMSHNDFIVKDEKLYATQGLLFLSCTKEEAEQLVQNFKSLLTDLAKNGFSQEDLERRIELLKQYISYDTEDRMNLAMEGFAYADNPLLCLDPAGIYDDLKKEDSSYFSELIKDYLLNHTVSVVSQGTVGEPEINITDEVSGNLNIKQIKKETEEFDAWINTKEDASVLEKNPKLEIGDFETLSDTSFPKQIKMENRVYNYVKSKDPNAFSTVLSFDLSSLMSQRGVKITQLLCSIFNRSLQEQGITDMSCVMQVYENKAVIDQYKPVFQIWIGGSKDKLEEKLEVIKKYFLSDVLIDKERLDSEIRAEKKPVDMMLQGFARDLELEAKAMLSPVGRYQKIASGYLGVGSRAYASWLESIDEEQYSALAYNLQTARKKILNTNTMTVSFYGSEDGFTSVKEKLEKLASALEQKEYETHEFGLPQMPFQSIAFTENFEEFTGGFNVVGSLVSSETPVHGSMQVLANFLNAYYLTSALRNAGTYGGEISVTANGGFKIEVARVSNVKKALDVLKETGNFLRNTKFTQETLDASIISTIYNMDQSYLYSNTAAVEFPMAGFTKESYMQLREEILSTTVEDIKAYADVLDQMISYEYILARGNQAWLDSFTIEFDTVKK